MRQLCKQLRFLRLNPLTNLSLEFSAAALGMAILFRRKYISPINSQIGIYEPHSLNVHFSSPFLHLYCLIIHCIFSPSLNLLLHTCVCVRAHARMHLFFSLHSSSWSKSSCLCLALMPRAGKGAQPGDCHTRCPQCPKFPNSLGSSVFQSLCTS